MKQLQQYAGLFALIAAIISALNYFPNKTDFNALADQVKQHGYELEYQNALRTYEFVSRQVERNPKDKELQLRLKEADSRLRRIEQKLIEKSVPANQPEK